MRKAFPMTVIMVAFVAATPSRTRFPARAITCAPYRFRRAPPDARRSA